jgi:hypothetical protein
MLSAIRVDRAAMRRREMERFCYGERSTTLERSQPCFSVIPAV